MKSVLCAALFFAMGLAWGADEKTPPSAEQIAAWVKQLGDDDFSTRSSAEAKLGDAGAAAEAALLKVKDSPDAEVRTRSARLLAVLKTEPLLKKMEAAAKDAQSIEADMSMMMKMMAMKQEMKGHFKSLADGKRFSMDMTMNTMGMDMKMHMVADGKTMWSEVDLPAGLPGGQGGKKMVQKFSMETIAKLGGQASQNPLDQVKQLRKQFLFTDVKEEKLGDVDVYVLEGTMRPELIEQQKRAAEDVAGGQAGAIAAAQMANMKKSRIFIAKSDMMFRKSEVLDDKGEAMMTMEMKNIKLGGKFDEKEFTYAPPAGVEVMDMEEMFKKAREGGGVEIENAVPPGN